MNKLKLHSSTVAVEAHAIHWTSSMTTGITSASYFSNDSEKIFEQRYRVKKEM